MVLSPYLYLFYDVRVRHKYTIKLPAGKIVKLKKISVFHEKWDNLVA